jgi:hypothetical protein
MPKVKNAPVLMMEFHMVVVVVVGGCELSAYKMKM